MVIGQTGSLLQANDQIGQWMPNSTQSSVLSQARSLIIGEMADNFRAAWVIYYNVRYVEFPTPGGPAGHGGEKCSNKSPKTGAYIDENNKSTFC